MKGLWMVSQVGKPIASVCLLLVGVTANVWGQAAAQSGSDSSESDSRALAIYEDAANFQNNRVYSLAIEEWQKLLKAYPNDPLASSAWHFLGIAQIKSDDPDYEAARKAFSQALKDDRLDYRGESLINLGWCLYTQARQPNREDQPELLRDAQRRFTDYLEKFPKGDFIDQALFYMGEIKYAAGNSNQAVRYYQKLLSSPDLAKSTLRPDAQYALGVAYEEQQSPAKAAQSYREFLKQHPQHRLTTEVAVRLADILLAQKDPAGAEKILNKIGSGETMDDYVLLRSGYALAQQGDQQAAAAKYRQLLEKYPASKHAATAAVSLGQLLFQQGNYEAAGEQFQLALKNKDAQSEDAAHWLAITLLRQNKPEAAMQVAKDALTWATSQTVTLRMDYADALYAMPDRLEQALAAYKAIATQHPQDSLAPRAAYNAAFAALQSRQFKQARQWSEWFLERFPQDPLRNDVAYVAAETLLLEGEHEAAIAAYTKLLKADPENPAYPLWTLRLATANYLAGNYQPAIKVIRQHMPKFAADDRQKAEALFVLGASLLYEEQLDEAIEQLSASHAASDSWTSADEVLLLLAEAYQRNKNNQAAKQTLRRLLEKYPQSRLKAQAEYKLGQLAASMAKFDEAIRIYQGIVTNPEAQSYHNFAQYGIAWSFMQQEEYAEALDQLEPLLAQRAQDSILRESKLARGVCLRKLGRVDEAIESLTEYLRGEATGISLGNGLYELGLAHTDNQDLEAANRQFRRLLKNIPNYPAADSAIYELAWNLHDLGQVEEATEYFSRLTEEYPNSEFAAEATYMQAQQFYESAQYERAAKSYTQVLRGSSDETLNEKARYKLAWSYFQEESYDQAAAEFERQSQNFPNGPLAVDAQFMQAECSFKQDNFDSAFSGYQAARQTLESNPETAASEQVKSLIYLHGAQCLREQKEWKKCEAWLRVITSRYSESPYIDIAQYELAYAKQKQNQFDEALRLYREVAEEYRNEIGARARFMMGELYFSQRDFTKAIPEFQRVMYKYGGDKAPPEIKNWQVKSAFEAARCSEVLIENLRGDARQKIIETASDFYDFIVKKHAEHELAAQAQTRLGELQNLR